MGRNMRTRIFWPVLAVILFLVIGVWSSFAVTSKWYASYMAQKNTKEMLRIVEEGRRTVSGESTKLQERETAREYSKELLQYVKSRIKTGTMDGNLLVFNSKMNQVYPKVPEDGKIPDGFQQACKSILTENTEIRNLEETRNIDGEFWYIRVFSLDTRYHIRAKYFVTAAQLPNLSRMWRYMSTLMIGITVSSIVIGVVLVWFVAGSITRPLKEFCLQVQSAGCEGSGPIQGNYSLTELEVMKDAYNKMERGIRENQESKKCFFQNVSHDLRTPLASIIGYAQGIQSGIMKNPQEAAGIILLESIRMKNLVESILTLTKMDNQELELQILEIDLEEFLEERLEALKGMAGSCSLELDVGCENVRIQTDVELLSRIIQNIISNCIRYAKNKVSVQLWKDTDHAVIQIEDDGAGFREEELSHVFERFYKGKNGNFGIGLAVVKSGIDYLGGRVEIGNLLLPQQGAFYRLYFPCS